MMRLRASSPTGGLVQVATVAGGPPLLCCATLLGDDAEVLAALGQGVDAINRCGDRFRAKRRFPAGVVGLGFGLRPNIGSVQILGGSAGP